MVLELLFEYGEHESSSVAQIPNVVRPPQSGESLKEVSDEHLEHAIRCLCGLLPSTSTKDCQVAQGSGTIALGKEGAEDSPNLEKMKRVKAMRQEPAGDCFLIEVLLEDSREIQRNFSPKGTYQEVYDWVGQETSQQYFTLHQFGSGFFSDAKLHNKNLLQSEKLCLITRKQDEATEIFGKDDEVSFYGNFDPDQSLDSTIPDDKDKGEHRDKVEENKTLSEELEKKKKKKTRKRRKKKNIASLQEGNKETSESVEVVNESNN